MPTDRAACAVTKEGEFEIRKWFETNSYTVQLIGTYDIVTLTKDPKKVNGFKVSVNNTTYSHKRMPFNKALKIAKELLWAKKITKD